MRNNGTAFICFILLMLAASVSRISSQENSTKPVLKIETVMHSGVTRRISSDKAGKYLLTSGEDKTARLWDSRTGDLLRVFRLEIGDYYIGSILGISLSPDGSQAFIGGVLEPEFDSEGYIQNTSVYVFTTDTGVLKNHIDSIKGDVADIQFHPNGKTFYCLARQKTGYHLEAYNSATSKMIFSTPEIPGTAEHFTVSGNGTICVGGSDNAVHFYSGKGESLGSLGNLPDFVTSIAFSNDSRYLAIGFNECLKIEVYDLQTKKVFFPDTEGIGARGLPTLAFSADGNLYAGEFTGTRGKLFMYRWENYGKGSRLSFDKATTDTVMDIIPFGTNGVAYITGEPAWGILSGKSVVYKKTSPIMDYYGIGSHLELSDTGDIVGFRNSVDRNQYFFDIRKLELGSKKSEATNGPITDTLDVRDWINSRTPKLGNEILELGEFNISRSLAIASDSKAFVLGTSWGLFYFDAKGQSLGVMSTLGEAWGADLSADGRYAVAALTDGTIRWFLLETGEVILNLMVLPDNQRWIAWTPSGFYACSAGTEDLIGWQVNNGPNLPADFISVGRFREQYYRPDVISRIIETGSETKSLELADLALDKKATSTQNISAILPPVISVLSPVNGTNVSDMNVSVDFDIRYPIGAPPLKVNALINGRSIAVSLDPGKQTQKGVMTGRIAVPTPGRAFGNSFDLSLIAENKNGASEPSSVRLTWTGQDVVPVKPILYALIIGVSDYHDSSLKLNFASMDASDFSKLLETQKGGMYSDVKTRMFLDSDATQANLLDGLKWIQKAPGAGDVAMVFLSGHGANDREGVFYYLPWDADKNRLDETCLGSSNIRDSISKIPAKVLFFVDACHSGNAYAKTGKTDIIPMLNEFSSAENGIIVYASSTGGQISMEDSKCQNGVFTEALLEGLAGKADFRNKGLISIYMLNLYLSERVKELTNGTQTPTTVIPSTMTDFEIAAWNPKK